MPSAAKTRQDVSRSRSAFEVYRGQKCMLAITRGEVAAIEERMLTDCLNGGCLYNTKRHLPSVTRNIKISGLITITVKKWP